MTSAEQLLVAASLLLCVTGLGRITAAALSAKWPADNQYGPVPCLGLASLLAALGVANALQWLRPTVYLVLFAAGVASWLVPRRRQDSNESLLNSGVVRTGVLILVGVILALPTLTRAAYTTLFIDTGGFNPHDDAYAYLVAVKRIIDLHGLGADPFNYRLSVAGAGGMHSLQAPVVNAFGWRGIWLIDQGLGGVLLIYGIVWLANRNKTPWLVTVSVLIGVFAVAAHDVANVTSHFTTLALMVALFACCIELGERLTPWSISVGLLLAGLAALKNTVLPAAVLLIGLLCAYRYGNHWRRTVVTLATIAVSAALPLIAWYMPRILQRTSLIPLRHGTGFDEVSLTYIWWWISTTPNRFSAWGYVGALVTAGMLACFAIHDRRRFIQAMICLVSVVLGGAAATWLTGGVAITRYNRPLAIFACAVLPTFLGGIISRPARRLILVIPAVLFSFVLCRNGVVPWTYPVDYKSSVASLFAPQTAYPPPELVAMTERVQSSVGPHRSALIRSSTPFLFDFARNDLNVVDFPYAASPRRGMSECRDAHCLLNYLAVLSIRYVIYSYRDQANFPNSVVAQRLADPYFTPWQRALNRNVVSFNAVLETLLADKRGIVYDDGRTAVIDVQKAIGRPGSS